MKRFLGILAFLAFFVPFAFFGGVFAFALWDGGGKSIPHPLLAVIVGAVFIFAGVFAGTHSAKATMIHFKKERLQKE